MAGIVAVVRKEKAQILRSLFERSSLWDSNRRLQKVNENEIAIPLQNSALDSLQRQQDGLYGIDSITFRIEHLNCSPSKKSGHLNPSQKLCSDIKNYVSDVLGWSWDDVLELDIPSKWERHGDLILLHDDAFKDSRWTDAGSALWEVVCKSFGAKRLARRAVITNNDFRSPQVHMLLGEDGWVKHVDNGIIYSFDVTRCMFSSGNITEKLRVATFACKGETIVDMFAGIGYFTLPYLVHAGAEMVYACEWNPDAVEALKQNLILNKVQDRCVVLAGDNRLVSPAGVADRVNLGLIPSSEISWETACKALKPHTGGILHIHGNVTDESPGTHGNAEASKSCSHGNLHATNSDKNSLVCESDNTTSLDKDAFVDSCGDKDNPQDKNICDRDTKTGNEYDCDKKRNNAGKYAKMAKFTKSQKHKPAWDIWAENVSQKIRAILSEIHKQDWNTVILHIELVKSYAPHVDHLVLDLECRPPDIKTCNS